MVKKRKRLTRGKDYDGWVFKRTDGGYNTYLCPLKPCAKFPDGKWVRVKIVEVT